MQWLGNVVTVSRRSLSLTFGSTLTLYCSLYCACYMNSRVAILDFCPVRCSTTTAIRTYRHAKKRPSNNNKDNHHHPILRLIFMEVSSMWNLLETLHCRQSITMRLKKILLSSYNATVMLRHWWKLLESQIVLSV